MAMHILGRKHGIAVAALAATLALGAAGTAQASFTTSVSGSTLTITGSAADDTINVAADNGKITVEDAPTTLAANQSAHIVANLGAGNDIFDAQRLTTDQYNDLTVNGGDGDDRLEGAAGADLLNGDAGDDVLQGHGGFDATNGGAGDDTATWNFGDGLELSDGGAGRDEFDVNGSPTAADAFTALPDQVVAGDATLTGDDVGLTFNAEDLEFVGDGGDDSFKAATDTPAVRQRLAQIVPNASLDGGPGNDDLEGFDGPNTLTPPVAHDTLSGGDGNDRLVGNGGLDFVDAGAGDDVIVWKDGDGTDLAAARAGEDELAVNGSDTGADAFTYGPQGGDPTFTDGAAGVVFTSGDAGPERLTLKGGGGDDTLAVAPGQVRPTVIADGGAGNDTFTGGDEIDTFLGGTGDDALDPGPGDDSVFGDAGNDRLSTRDGTADRVSGGDGTDSARTDATSVDTVDGVENLDVPTVPTSVPPPQVASSTPPAGTLAIDAVKAAIATRPTVGGATLRRRHGRLVAGFAVACPAPSAGVCVARIAVTAARGGRTLGTKPLTLAGGARTHVQILLARSADRLARRGTLRLAVRTTTTGAPAATVRLRLRVPRR
jgi:Ca2+-binding RTX toxin-like protein